MEHTTRRSTVAGHHQYNAWKQIAEGEALLKQGKRQEGMFHIVRGNNDLLKHEQYRVLGSAAGKGKGVYSRYPNEAVAVSREIKSPIPPALLPPGVTPSPKFGTFMPGGNFFDDDQRWKYMEVVQAEWWQAAGRSPDAVKKWMEDRLKEGNLPKPPDLSPGLQQAIDDLLRKGAKP